MCLFADTYKLEVTKIDGGAKVRFRVENLTNPYAGANSFSVINGADYTSSDYDLSGVITNLDTRTALLKFGFGSFRVCYDYRSEILKLEGGDKKDSLLIERLFFPGLVVENQKQLRAGTLILREVVSFKNCGGIEASNVLLLDCNQVINTGCFCAGSLFLIGTNVQNYNAILHGKTFKTVDCKVIDLKKGNQVGREGEHYSNIDVKLLNKTSNANVKQTMGWENGSSALASKTENA